jgi:hypothetical protein
MDTAEQILEASLLLLNEYNNEGAEERIGLPWDHFSAQTQKAFVVLPCIIL